MGLFMMEPSAGGVWVGARREEVLVESAGRTFTGNGVGGIRTLDRGFRPYNGLANRRLQPLGHHSGDRGKRPSIPGYATRRGRPAATGPLGALRRRVRRPGRRPWWRQTSTTGLLHAPCTVWAAPSPAMCAAAIFGADRRLGRSSHVESTAGVDRGRRGRGPRDRVRAALAAPGTAAARPRGGRARQLHRGPRDPPGAVRGHGPPRLVAARRGPIPLPGAPAQRSEEHTSEPQAPR